MEILLVLLFWGSIIGGLFWWLERTHRRDFERTEKLRAELERAWDNAIKNAKPGTVGAMFQEKK